MSEDEMRLECLKLATEWCMMRYREGFSGIGQDDVLERAEKLFEFVKGNDWTNA